MDKDKGTFFKNGKSCLYLTLLKAKLAVSIKYCDDMFVIFVFDFFLFLIFRHGIKTGAISFHPL